MDKNEFRQRLEELAVIKDRKPTKTPSHNRLAKEVVTEIDEETGEEIEVEREITENSTLGFELVKLKDRTAMCELGCGDIVTNQVVESRLCDYPKPHWRTRCSSCGCFVSPDGLGFIEGGHAVQAAYQKYFRQVQETVTNDKIIRKYE